MANVVIFILFTKKITEKEMEAKNLIDKIVQFKLINVKSKTKQKTSKKTKISTMVAN